MKIRIYIYVIILSCIYGLCSCKKFVDVGTPKNQLVTSKVFADSAGANSAVIGIYVDMMQNFGFNFSSGGLTAYTGLTGDELIQTSNEPELVQFSSNIIDPRNSINQTLWITAYKFLYDANACIDGITNSSTISPNAKNKLLGEAKQIRALILFNLVNLYGPVPLIVSTDYGKNRILPRAPIDSVYAQILKDLTYAQSVLPRVTQNGRATYYSATALLAKVQLYRGNYSAAEEAASIIINSGQYGIEQDLNDVFLAGSHETIWDLIPVFPGIETWEGYNFVPSDPNAPPKYVITSSLYNSFDAGDLRKANWINTNTIDGVNYPYPCKYKAATTSGSPTESYVLLRLAELYLIRAEARLKLNNIAGAKADIVVIRKRAGLTSLLPDDLTGLSKVIDKERRSELFCESANRWFDLKRNGLIDEVLNPLKSNWSSNYSLFPIPLSEIQSNPTLKQNSGY